MMKPDIHTAKLYRAHLLASLNRDENYESREKAHNRVARVVLAAASGESGVMNG